MKLLITGGSSDIAKAIIRRRHAQGDEIILTCSAAASLEKTLAALESEGIRASGFVFDLSNPGAASEAKERALAGGIDAVVLNACSRLERRRPFHQIGERESREFIDENIHGNLWLLRRVLPAMVDARFGRLVFISSLSAAAGTSRYGIYCLAKSALEGLFLNLAVDYGRHGITANVIRPGVIKTERTRKFWEDEAYVEKASRAIPQAALGKPESVAEALDPLLSANSYMNGSVVHVTGGLPLLRIGDAP